MQNDGRRLDVVLFDIRVTKPFPFSPSHVPWRGSLFQIRSKAGRDFCECRNRTVGAIWKDGDGLTKLKEDLAKTVPLGRLGDPDEIAKAVIFLASKRSQLGLRR